MFPHSSQLQCIYMYMLPSQFCQLSRNWPLFLHRYANNATAWQTSTTFEGWLDDFRLECAAEHGHDVEIKLLMDNSSTHSYPKDHVQMTWGDGAIKGYKWKNIIVGFLPPDTTTQVQPMDMGIIAAFKCGYRKRHVRWLVNMVDAEHEQRMACPGAPLTYKKRRRKKGEEREGAMDVADQRIRAEHYHVNMRQAIEWMSESWYGLASQTFANCWIKSGLLGGITLAEVSAATNKGNSKARGDPMVEDMAEISRGLQHLRPFSSSNEVANLSSPSLAEVKQMDSTETTADVRLMTANELVACDDESECPISAELDLKELCCLGNNARAERLADVSAKRGRASFEKDDSDASSSDSDVEPEVVSLATARVCSRKLLTFLEANVRGAVIPKPAQRSGAAFRVSDDDMLDIMASLSERLERMRTTTTMIQPSITHMFSPVKMAHLPPAPAPSPSSELTPVKERQEVNLVPRTLGPCLQLFLGEMGTGYGAPPPRPAATANALLCDIDLTLSDDLDTVDLKPKLDPTAVRNARQTLWEASTLSEPWGVGCNEEVLAKVNWRSCAEEDENDAAMDVCCVCAPGFGPLHPTLEDLSRLLESAWLNDELINAYFALLAHLPGGQANDPKQPLFLLVNSFFYTKLACGGEESFVELAGWVSCAQTLSGRVLESFPH